MAKLTSARSRSGRWLLLSIFLLGAPFGVCWMMAQSTPQGWFAGALAAVISGALSVAWASAFMFERWWLLALVVPGQLFVPRALFEVCERVGLLELGTSVEPQTRLIVLLIMYVLLTASGFTLFMVQFRRTEHRAARHAAELDLARQVHQLLAPAIQAKTDRYEIAGRSLACTSMGGDLLDMVQRQSGVDLMLGDVSGHGIGAGVVMAMLKSCVRTRVRQGDSLADVVTNANRVLAELTRVDTFATLAAIRLDDDGSACYVLAGHLPIFHYSAVTGCWRRHENQSLPLGIDADEGFEACALTLQRGDILVVVTDGLVEVYGASRRQFGLDGIERVLRDVGPAALDTISDRLSEAVAAHSATPGERLDDQSILLVRRM